MDQRGLIFPFKGLLDECEALKAYARDVLDKRTISALDEAKSTLENIQVARATNRTSRWSIPMERPLCTIWSDGESQPKSRSGHKVKGKFSFVWEIRPLDEGKWRNGKYFLLDGLASTAITVVDERDGVERCIARWTVEIGDHQSPGAHFHFQLNGFEQPPFPKSLDVPRLPSPLMSPFLAIDFAIGELFQDRWSAYAVTEGKETNWWRGIHKDRLLRFFKWQSQCVAGCTGSPWMTLKLAKPDRELLVAETG